MSGESVVCFDIMNQRVPRKYDRIKMNTISLMTWKPLIKKICYRILLLSIDLSSHFSFLNSMVCISFFLYLERTIILKRYRFKRIRILLILKILRRYSSPMFSSLMLFLKITLIGQARIARKSKKKGPFR